MGGQRPRTDGRQGPVRRSLRGRQQGVKADRLANGRRQPHGLITKKAHSRKSTGFGVRRAGFFSDPVPYKL